MTKSIAFLSALAAASCRFSNAVESCNACASGNDVSSLSFTITVHSGKLPSDASRTAPATITIADARNPSQVYGSRMFAPGESFRIRSRDSLPDGYGDSKGQGKDFASGFVVLSGSGASEEGGSDSPTDQVSRRSVANGAVDFVVDGADSREQHTLRNMLRQRRGKGSKAPKAKGKGGKAKGKGGKAKGKGGMATGGLVTGGGTDGNLPEKLLITVHHPDGGVEEITVPGQCDANGNIGTKRKAKAKANGELVIGNTFGSITLVGYSLDKGAEDGVQQGKIITNQVNANTGCEAAMVGKGSKVKNAATPGASTSFRSTRPHQNAIGVLASIAACAVLVVGVMIQRRRDAVVKESRMMVSNRDPNAVETDAFFVSI